MYLVYHTVSYALIYNEVTWNMKKKLLNVPMTFLNNIYSKIYLNTLNDGIADLENKDMGENIHYTHYKLRSYQHIAGQY